MLNKGSLNARCDIALRVNKSRVLKFVPESKKTSAHTYLYSIAYHALDIVFAIGLNLHGLAQV